MELDLLKDAAKILHAQVSNAQAEALLRIRDMLIEASAKFNVTSIVDPSQALTRHIIDSMTLLAAIPENIRKKPRKMLDVGSGAGFPCLPIAVLLPHWQVYSLEATAKKANLQRQIADAADLQNFTVLTGRSEVFARDDSLRGSFHIVTARAVAATPTLLEWILPFAQVNALTFAMKKGEIADEVRQATYAAHILGAAEPEIISLPAELCALAPDLADNRVILRFRQLKLTGKTFPRPSGLPQTKPLTPENL